MGTPQEHEVAAAIPRPQQLLQLLHQGLLNDHRTPDATDEEERAVALGSPPNCGLQETEGNVC